MNALRIIATEYARGAVVKLAESQASPPIAKYVTERDAAGWRIRRAETVIRAGKPAVILVTEAGCYPTAAEAINAATRACERIRAGAGHGIG